ncbi:hypothetical protein CR532_01810 [Candidatus Borreliella tachyglossi]|uniref:Uncharacterized protein n=1 Tax=Candidatus Borreliella tachyglossi TaxID=1964448 RepID=A0A2S1LWQ3_9SPIR|nr:hypothetical protein [Candidatus Borreliella tachyglossi]AWG42737.1 hypothetical protein CR532_01810 [Candidatus Borreliella tachyglossi]
MKKELYAFLSNFISFLFLFIVLVFSYTYFLGADYLERYRLIATFFDVIISIYNYFNGFFIFFICIYFIFLSKYETRLYLKEYRGYLFSRFYPFIFLFFIVGIVLTLVFNLILPHVHTQRSEYKYSYERYNFLDSQANEIIIKVKDIDINLSANKILDADDLLGAMNQKRKHLEELLRIYNKMRLIDYSNDELSTNYYLVKSEYDRMPIYDVDLEKVRKNIKMYLLKNLTKDDFKNIVNEFIDKGDYSTANYFAYIGFASTRDDELAVLLNLTFKALSEYKNIEIEKRYSVFEEKQKNFLYLNTEKFKPAYYGFLKLHKLFPNDNEILSYKNKSLEKLRGEYLFFDEIEKYYEYYGINDVFLFQPDSTNGTYDYIYMQKVVNSVSYIKMVKNFELIRFNKLGSVILHVKVPFATLKGNQVYQNVLDKDNEDNRITATTVMVSPRGFELSESNVININKDVNNLHLFSNSSRDSVFLPIQDLPNAFNQIGMLNLRLISIFSSSLFLLINPILLVLLGVLFMSVSSKVSFEFESKLIIFLISLIIAIFAGIISLIVNYLLFILIALLIQIFINIYISFFFIFSALLFIVFHLILVSYRES